MTNPNQHSLIGKSSSLEKIREIIGKVAPTSAPVLLLGESGTGKEVIANEIHSHSQRHDKPFVAINCVALSEGLLESELFGHERGSFTGAVAKKEGLFEIAHGGTLFLDEIGEINSTLQVKLLRFLQEHEIQRVGGTEIIKVDVRVIAATNKKIEDEVRDKRFREDLYYRLNVFDINVPPLRERKEDIPLLTDYFLNKLRGRLAMSNLRVDPLALDRLCSYDWPGNIRELEHVLERASIISQDQVITLQDLPEKVNYHTASPSETIESREKIKIMEREMILKAMKQAEGNQTKAARMLGMKRSTLQYHLQKGSKAAT